MNLINRLVGDFFLLVYKGARQLQETLGWIMDERENIKENGKTNIVEDKRQTGCAEEEGL